MTIKAKFGRGKIAAASCCLLGMFGLSSQASIAASAEVCARDICVSDAWIRATPPGARNAAVYFSIANKGHTADALLSASSSAAPGAMVHRSVRAGNIVRMEMAGRVELAPDTHLTFAPVGYHLMLEGLKQPLSEGKTAPVTLDFEKAGKLTFSVPILSVAATGPKPSSSEPAANPSGAHAHH